VADAVTASAVFLAASASVGAVLGALPGTAAGLLAGGSVVLEALDSSGQGGGGGGDGDPGVEDAGAAAGASAGGAGSPSLLVVGMRVGFGVVAGLAVAVLLHASVGGAVGWCVLAALASTVGFRRGTSAAVLVLSVGVGLGGGAVVAMPVGFMHGPAAAGGAGAAVAVVLACVLLAGGRASSAGSSRGGGGGGEAGTGGNATGSEMDYGTVLRARACLRV
jgi:hypothetical protein